MLNEIKKALPGIPGVTPGKAQPEHRAERKQYEKENPHFNMQEFGLKAGVLALMGALAFVPWEKKYDEHQEKHDDERREEQRDREKRRRRSVGERRTPNARRSNGRRRSVDGRYNERVVRREYPAESDLDRRRSFADNYGRVENERKIRGAQERVGRSERGSNREPERGPQSSMRMAVAEGFQYLPANREYLDTKRSAREDDFDRRVYTDDYRFRPQRASDDRRRQ